MWSAKSGFFFSTFFFFHGAVNRRTLHSAEWIYLRYGGHTLYSVPFIYRMTEIGLLPLFVALQCLCCLCRFISEWHIDFRDHPNTYLTAFFLNECTVQLVSGFHFNLWNLQKCTNSRIHRVAWNQFLGNYFVFLAVSALVNSSLCPRLLQVSCHPLAAPSVWLRPHGFFWCRVPASAGSRKQRWRSGGPRHKPGADKYTQTLMAYMIRMHYNVKSICVVLKSNIMWVVE